MPSIPWKAFGAAFPPRRFPRVRRGGKRQSIPKVEEWKIVRGDQVSMTSKSPNEILLVSMYIRNLSLLCCLVPQNFSY